ncbi:hypothetical protein GE061_002274 [Apolygus lucorum]|uniref:Uncharacterized protein n=1 Tax=Apolygus lucorum TaxID=248454 RepID=A0A6A4JJX0_APOLU|nr:hypothetical protein GE061_002274 [Apolygus lucorum]
MAGGNLLLGKRLYFSKEDDIELLGLTVNENPFKDPAKWGIIADVLKGRRLKPFTAKNIRDRVSLLLSLFRVRDKKLQFSSGKEEGYDEVEQLLQEASDLKSEIEMNPALKVRKRKATLAHLGLNDREEAARALEAKTPTFTVEVVEDLNEPLNFDQLQRFREEPNQIEEEPFMRQISEVSGDSTPPDHLSPETTIIHSETPQCDKKHKSQTVSNLPGTSVSSQRTSDTPGRASPGFSGSRPHEPSATLSSVNKPPPRPTKSQNSLVQQIWSKLKDEQNFKTEQVLVEKMRAENDRKRLEVEETKIKLNYDLECRKLNLQESQMNLIKEQSEQSQDCIKKIMCLVEKLIQNHQ